MLTDINKKNIILLTGQCSLHNARMEFGNLGNFYVIQPLIDNLNKKFKDYTIYSTLQFSNNFCKKNNIRLLPLDYYYSFEEQNKNLENTLYELDCSYKYKNGESTIMTDFMKYIIKSKFVIEFNGDIWGDNADCFGENRFLIGLYKTIIFQNCNKNVYNFAGSPGPFINNIKYIELIKNTFKNYKYLVNREKISTQLLINDSFDKSNIHSYPCPSWLFKSNLSDSEINSLYLKDNINRNNQEYLIGLILCGWNIKKKNWDDKTYEENDFHEIIEVIKYINNNYTNSKLILISHNNSFDHESQRMNNGRDFTLLKQLYEYLKNNNNLNMENIILKENPTTANETKGFISKLDFMISGRLHGSVAALTSCIPTIMLKYMNGPKCHKLDGFAEFINYNEYISEVNGSTICKKFDFIYENKNKIIDHLKFNIDKVKMKVLESFNLLD